MKNLEPIFVFLAILLLLSTSFAQTETLTNAQIIEMARAGLANEIIVRKINSSQTNFDLSASGLIDLKKAGVDDLIISQMMDKAEAKPVLADPSSQQPGKEQGYSENLPSSQPLRSPGSVVTPKDALKKARTIAFVKSSIHPSRQALEKELLKRADWKQFHLTIERYKDKADLYVEIGYVPLSWITHRFVYRIFDRRSGAVLAAGETTSWGSLAENLAKHIVRSLGALETS